MYSPPHDCLTDAEVEDYILKRTPRHRLDAIEEHLLVCHDCIERVEAEERFVRDFRPVAELFEKRANARKPNNEAGSTHSDSLGWLAAFWLRPQGWMVAGAAVAVVMIAFALNERARTEAQRPAYLDIAVGGGVAQAALAGPRRADATMRVSIALDGAAPLSEYAVEMVDNIGEIAASATLKPSGGKLVWRTGITPQSGAYWVRVSDPANPATPLREFGIRIAQ